MSENSDPETRDAAWVKIETPMPREWMQAFITDIPRIFRINSLMKFTEFTELAPGLYRIAGTNLSNDQTFEYEITSTEIKDGIRVNYNQGLKSETRIELADDGTSLSISDEYDDAVSPEEREQRLNEVDKSLTQWGYDIHRYLRLWKRWSKLPGWTWYMQKIWQTMSPSARRISNMLIWITIAEFVFFLAVFSIFWLELN